MTKERAALHPVFQKSPEKGCLRGVLVAVRTESARESKAAGRCKHNQRRLRWSDALPNTADVKGHLELNGGGLET